MSHGVVAFFRAIQARLGATLGDNGFSLSQNLGSFGSFALGSSPTLSNHSRVGSGAIVIATAASTLSVATDATTAAAVVSLPRFAVAVGRRRLAKSEESNETEEEHLGGTGEREGDEMKKGKEEKYRASSNR